MRNENASVTLQIPTRKEVKHGSRLNKYSNTASQHYTLYILLHIIHIKENVHKERIWSLKMKLIYIKLQFWLNQSQFI